MIKIIANKNATFRITDQGLTLGDIEINDHHSQDCCEEVYVAWKDNDAHKQEFEDISHLKIEGIAGYGLKVHLYAERDGWFISPITSFNIPAYNSQNGYYSDQLDLLIKTEGGTIEWDITEFKEDDIF